MVKRRWFDLKCRCNTCKPTWRPNSPKTTPPSITPPPPTTTWSRRLRNMKTSSTTQHHISISLFVSIFSLKSFLIICNPSLLPGCRPFHFFSLSTPPPSFPPFVQMSTWLGEMLQTSFCSTLPSRTNWARILAVKNGKANQFSRVLVGLCSQRSVAAAVNTIHSRGQHSCRCFIFACVCLLLLLLLIVDLR